MDSLKYAPLKIVKQLNKLIENKEDLTSDEKGISKHNRPYLYKVKKENDDITSHKFNELLSELYDQGFIKLPEYKDLKVQDNLDREIDLIKFETFDHLWDQLWHNAEKRLERSFEISKEIIKERFKNNKNIYFLPNFHRSLNINISKDINESSTNNAAIIADCLGRQYSVDGVKFLDRSHYVRSFQVSRKAFELLNKEKIDVFAGSRNFLVPFDFDFREYPTKKNSIIKIFIQYRSFNFLNFGEKEQETLTIPQSISNETDLYKNCYEKIENFLKNCDIL